jgi:hypothetical protein
MHPMKAVVAVTAAVVLACAAAWGAALDEELRSAAERGDAEAQGKLGVMLLTGAGVPQDRAEGLKWIRMAAEQGSAPAQNCWAGCMPRARALRATTPRR